MRRRRILLIVGLAACVCTAGATVAQAQATVSPAQEEGPVVTLRLIDVTRLETWSFFEPPVGGGDPAYSLLGNRAMLSVGMRSRRVDLRGAFQYSLLLGIPSNATGPGPLGPGASYFEASGTPRAYQLHIRAMSIRLKGGGGFSLEAGRLDVTSAASTATRSAQLQRLTRDRLAGRLIGNADWTPFERAFDGARVDLHRSRWRLTSSVAWPTQGAFEESANPTISALRVITAEVAISAGSNVAGTLPDADAAGGNGSPRPFELQLFAMHYRDRRAVEERPDNSGLGAEAADVDIATIGGSHAGVLPWRGGQFESVVWMAGQFGTWYGDDHDAFSAIVEGAYQFHARSRPRVAGNFIHASGDNDSRDRKHGTFFPMLPTTAPALLGGTFAQMNFRQFSADVRATPSPRLELSASVARLALARSEDRWYSGTGATAIEGTYFGFSGRPSAFATGLGTLLQIGADVRMTGAWRLNAAFGTIAGGDVVRRQFSGSRLFVFSLESRLAL